MTKDFFKPSFMSILHYRKQGITIWPAFQRKPVYKTNERYTCVLKGTETFKIVSPAYKQHIYSNVFEELQPQESPIDFFHPNTTEFKMFKKAKVLTVEVQEGGCLFIPAFYWAQS